MGTGASNPTTHKDRNTKRVSQSTAAIRESSREESFEDELKQNLEELVLKNFRNIYSDIFKYYKLSKTPIGSGSYGKVYKAVHLKTGKTVAVKMIPFTKFGSNTKLNVINEFNLLKKMDHPNILKVYELYESMDHIYIVSEFCEGGNLLQRIKDKNGLQEAQALSIMRQLLTGVSVLHSHKIVHRDIKPENILLQKNGNDLIVKIADFGLAVELTPGTKIHRVVGTSRYASPEKIMGQYDEKSDIWAAGIVLHRMINAEPLFASKLPEQLEKQIIQGNLKLKGKKWEKITTELKGLLIALLWADPEGRPSAAEALNHKWFTDNQVKTTELAKFFTKRVSKVLSKSGLPKSDIHELVLDNIIHHFLDREDRESIGMIFNHFDLRRKGYLTLQEIIDGFYNLDSSAFAKVNVENLVSSLKNTEKINYQKFIYLCVDLEKIITKSRLEKIFLLLSNAEKTKEGALSPEEMKTFVERTHSLVEITEEKWSDFVKSGTNIQDHYISFKEFQEVMGQAF